jgi:hypothetical protein
MLRIATAIGSTHGECGFRRSAILAGRLEINVEDTDTCFRPFIPVAVDRSGSDWYICRVEGTVFEARGGANNLADLLSVFLEWAERHAG